MAELAEQLGLDWKLLLSQAVNFLLLLFLLRKFAYLPLLKILKERRARIEEGLAKATEADKRLLEVDGSFDDALAAACRAANRDQALEDEIHAWQSFEDGVEE